MSLNLPGRDRRQSATSGPEARDARLTLSLSGTNLERAGDYNQRIVLQAIRLTEETTRSDLARVTGLTPPTIVNITKRLIDLGLVKPAGRLQGKRGQPAMRIVIDRPVVGVTHSLQTKDNQPIDAKCSAAGESLSFDFPVRIAPGPKFLGEHVRREGAERRFVYICIGQSAGDEASPWTRRMKIDIHDMEQELLDRALRGGIIEITVSGTGKDGTPACATTRPIGWRIA